MARAWFGAALTLAVSCIALAGEVGAAASSPPPAYPAKAIPERQARDIAWRFGIVRVEEITLTGVFWHIAGRDEEGNDVVLDVDAKDGRILN
ncbi:PepSY domain-containing protein [Bosea sp. PAMC 26642]|uniref:PepSY domain-containing protein n=1 Tax=Bosea sp. (strain PAMC 26642) TaxID=1792307 RepID=UPI0007702122|nr:PepSY domain-containing protein [Bosea sp. PAMC 26642]AMJ60608.1 hypothetical protein AXW83_10165 [Bosea sp. PAMC 26642]